MNILAAVSGGRSSAMMAYHLMTNPKYKDDNIAFVFANTGMERPETIDFLKAMEKHWNLPLIKIEGLYSTTMGVGVRYAIKEWDELDMTAKPFTESIAHVNKGSYNGIPNSEAPYCSDYLKVRPMTRFAKDYFKGEKFVKAIGFRAEDMPKRISWAEIKVEKDRIFPLITDYQAPITQRDLTNFFAGQPFKLSIHGKFGNCELCWKKSDRNLVEVIRYGTRFVGWWETMEEQYGNTSFRGNKSIKDFVKMAQEGYTPELDFGQEDFNCVCS